MKEKLPLLCPVIGLISFIAITIAVEGGGMNFVYFVLIPFSFLAILYLMNKLLSDLWVGIIMSILLVLTFHFLLRSWGFTIIIFSYFVIVISAYQIIKSKKWLNFSIITVNIVMIVMLFAFVNMQ